MGYGSTAKYDDLLNTNQLTLDLLLDDDSVKFEVKANPRLGELYFIAFSLAFSSFVTILYGSHTLCFYLRVFFHTSFVRLSFYFYLIYLILFCILTLLYPQCLST